MEALEGTNGFDQSQQVSQVPQPTCDTIQLSEWNSAVCSLHSAWVCAFRMIRLLAADVPANRILRFMYVH